MSFTVYRSSAGSGKTFTLVKEYLKIAIGNEPASAQSYRKILAITFTNKAAAEMKDRIIRALKQLSENSSAGEPILKILTDELAMDAERIRERASLVLESVLHNYSDFAVGTIDSFVHRILRSFAFDLKIPFAFDVETDADRLLTLAVDQLISRVGSDDKLSKMLIEFTEGKVSDEQNWNIEHDLKKFAKTLLKEDGINYIEKLKNLSTDDFFEIRDTLNKNISSFESEVKEWANKSITTIKNAGLSEEDFYYAKSGIGFYFKKLSEGRMDGITPNSRVTETVGEDKWFGTKVGEAIKGSINGIKSDLLTFFSQIQNLLEKRFSEYSLFLLLRKNIYSLAVLNEIEKIVESIKVNNNILHISEFSKIISKIVLSQPVPFIYERLGEKYANYLLDEFQDTSILQFHNLLPLIDNSLAQNHFTMIVGDGKQAIYRWRGGDVEQFSGLPNVYGERNNPFVEEREASLVRHYNPMNLSRNFRSKAELVKFNNDFFRTLSQNLDIKHAPVYSALEQEYDSTNSGGYVSLRLLEKDDAFRQKCLDQTLEIIREAKEDGYFYSDITVLVRKNTEGNTIAEYLNQHKVPVISGDSLLLKSSAKVNLIIALLEFLRKPDDAIARAVILKSLVPEGQSFSSFDVHLKQASATTDEFIQYLASKGILLNPGFLLRLPLYDICAELIKVVKFDHKEDDYIRFFLEEVLKYSRKNEETIDDFLSWWSDEGNKPSVVTPGGINAVTIMTIHRSKGLEFPVVIIPFAGWKTSGQGDNLWVSINNEKIPKLTSAILPITQSMENTEFAERYREEKSKSLLDNLNLLYVAFTRPEDRLYILSPLSSSNPKVFGNTADMIGRYIMQSGLYEEGKLDYSFGAKATSRKQRKKEANAYSALPFEHAEWREILKLRRTYSGVKLSEHAKKSRDYGILVHDVFSRIQSLTDIPFILDSMLIHGQVDEQVKNQIRDQLDEITKKEDIRRLFSMPGTVKIETELLLPDGTLYRPDRVVLYENKAAVIDFKTGEKAASHARQLKKYAETLAQMGVNPVEKYILYTRDGVVEKIN